MLDLISINSFEKIIRIPYKNSGCKKGLDIKDIETIFEDVKYYNEKITLTDVLENSCFYDSIEDFFYTYIERYVDKNGFVEAFQNMAKGLDNDFIIVEFLSNQTIYVLE